MQWGLSMIPCRGTKILHVKVKVTVAESCLTLWEGQNSPGQNTGVDSLFPFPGDLPNPEIEPRSPSLQVDSLPAEPQGKPKNTGVGSLSLLQGIFLTQESSCDLLHCRWILYQLSYQGYQGSLVAGKRFRNLLGMHYSYEKLHCTLHKMKDVNHHISFIPPGKKISMYFAVGNILRWPLKTLSLIYSHYSLECVGNWI